MPNQEQSLEAPAPSVPTQAADRLSAVPAELKVLPTWLVWKTQERDGVHTKVPYNARTGTCASATDPQTWSSYHDALAARRGHDGLGCVITPPYNGIDLDKCRDPETGEVEKWALEIINEINSYTEVSPSGRGVHIWVKGSLPKGRRRVGRVEMYDEGRYFTVTGDCLEGPSCLIETRDLSSLHSQIEHLDPRRQKPLEETTHSSPQLDLLSSARFDRLFGGHWEELYPSQSEADEALCALLARRYGSDAGKIDHEFRRSKLMRPKWDEMRGSATYGHITIRKAIALVCRTSGDEPQLIRMDAPIDWRRAFRSYKELEKGKFQFLIDKLIPHGITFIAGLSGAGKTWFALSIAKAIVFGRQSLQNFDVPSAIPVLYLIPESGERAFRTRLETMRLTEAGDNFLCRTMGSGKCLGLDSPEILKAVRSLKPVVVLDTAIRFSKAQDENSAAQNRALADEMFALSNEGARGIVAVHHSPKASAKESQMTLENTLRGTGDLGAISDAVYALKMKDQEKLEILVQCVKARDFEPVRPFRIQGRPHINEDGDFGILAAPSLETQHCEIANLERAIINNPHASLREIAQAIGINKNRVTAIASRAGWVKRDNVWVLEKTSVQ